MKKSVEAFVTIMDTNVNEGASLIRASAAVGISVATLCRWLAASAEHPEEWTFTWGDFGTEPFHVHFKNSRRISIEVGKGEVIRGLTRGHKRQQIFQGREVWAQNPVLAADALDPEMWALLHGDRPITDTYARDPKTGGLVPLMIEDAPNAQLQSTTLRALGGPEWADKRTVDLKVTQNPGVSVVRSAPQIPAPTPGYVEEPPDDDESEPQGSPPVSLIAPPSTEVAVASQNLDDPPEMTASGEPADVAPAKSASNIRAEFEALLRKSQQSPGSKTPKLPVNTGLPSDLAPTKEC